MKFAQRDSETLIDRIYEAAAFPDLWPEVLDGVARAGDAAGAILFANSSHETMGAWGGMISSPAVAAATEALANSDIPQRTRATPLLLSLDLPGFDSTSQGFSPEEWEADPLNAEWGKKWGFGHAAASAIRSPSGEFAIVHAVASVKKYDFTRQDLDRFDTLRPHLARSVLLASRWRLERLRIAAEALALIGLPALILDSSARVLAANSLIEAMKAHVKWLAKDGVALIDLAADKMLRLGLARLNDPSAPSVRSFAARARSGDNPVVAHLVPTPGQARDLFDGALGVLVLTPVTAPEAPDAALIRGLFDLTPREATVARAITQGLTVNEIAARDGVGRETIRSQVKSVLSKTGTRRRAEAAALFSGLAKLPAG